MNSGHYNLFQKKSRKQYFFLILKQRQKTNSILYISSASGGIYFGGSLSLGLFTPKKMKEVKCEDVWDRLKWNSTQYPDRASYIRLNREKEKKTKKSCHFKTSCSPNDDQQKTVCSERVSMSWFWAIFLPIRFVQSRRAPVAIISSS